MKKTILLLSFYSFFLLSFNNVKAFTTKTSHLSHLLDDEYDKFRKEGDSLFHQSQYSKALKKYLSCLEVPGFSEDKYAQKQASLCQKAIQLHDDATNALAQDNNAEALKHLKEVLIINSDDIIAKEKIGNYWLASGKKKISKGLYSDAKKDLEESLKYYSQSEVLNLLIFCNEKIKNENKIIPKKDEINIATSKGGPLKIIVGIVCVSSIGYALNLNKTWTEKNEAIQTAIKNNNYNDYLIAYDNASKFQTNKGLRDICIGVAVVSALAEGYLFYRKPQKHSSQVTLTPSNSSWGLALNYHF
jgi:tetratricopeptide (TPR) repeat protein